MNQENRHGQDGSGVPKDMKGDVLENKLELVKDEAVLGLVISKVKELFGKELNNKTVEEVFGIVAEMYVYFFFQSHTKKGLRELTIDEYKKTIGYFFKLQRPGSILVKKKGEIKTDALVAELDGLYIDEVGKHIIVIEVKAGNQSKYGKAFSAQRRALLEEAFAPYLNEKYQIKYTLYVHADKDITIAQTNPTFAELAGKMLIKKLPYSYNKIVDISQKLIAGKI